MADCTDQAINTPCVILTGASSQIGVFVIPRLVRAGFSVFAVSRKGKPEHYPAFKQVIWLDVAAAVKACQHCDYLLSAGPLELADKFLMAGGQFQKTIVFSSSSVETKQESGDPEEKRQIRDMLQLESKLQLAAQSKELELLILRPTLIYGCGMDATSAGWQTGSADLVLYRSMERPRVCGNRYMQMTWRNSHYLQC